MKLLDINVWLAAIWARHSLHSVSKSWMDREADSLALCRVSQMGILRLVSNPSVTGSDCLTRRGAWDLMGRLLADPRVRLVAEPDGIEPLWLAFSKRDDRSHLLWTDDYLAAFAAAAGAEFVTLDRRLRHRYPSARITVLP